MTRARGKGHIPNKPDARDRPIGALIQQLGAVTPLPDTASLRSFAGVVNDQSITSSCVAQAGTKAVLTRARVLGVMVPELSALASYAITRGFSMVKGEPMVDQGSIPRDFFRGAQGFGVVAESRWPFDPAVVNDVLPLDVFEAAADAKVSTYHVIEEEGTARAQRIRETIHGGTGVCFAMPVDKAYEELETADVYQGRTGPSLGGHYQFICGYGPGYFEILSSWGIGHGAAGLVRIAADYIGNPVECTDLMAIDVAPAGGVT